MLKRTFILCTTVSTEFQYWIDGRTEILYQSVTDAREKLSLAAQCIVIGSVCGFVCLLVCVFVGLLLYDNSILRASIFAKLGL